MARKTTHLIPAFAVIFALTLVFASPNAMAQPDGDGSLHDADKSRDKKYDDKYHHAPKSILLEGFSGTIQLSAGETKDNHDQLRDQISVTLVQAASVAEENGFSDAMKAELGFVEDENQNKYVAWIITSMSEDEESQTMIMNKFVVDAADPENFATVSKTFEGSGMYDHGDYEDDHGDYHKDGSSMLSDPEHVEKKIQKLERMLNGGTGDAESNQLLIEAIYHLRMLQTAIADEDEQKIDSLHDQIQKLKEQMISLEKSK